MNAMSIRSQGVAVELNTFKLS